MDNLHDKLMQQDGIYAKWHNHPKHHIIQWLVLLLVVASVASLLVHRASQPQLASYGLNSKADITPTYEPQFAQYDYNNDGVVDSNDVGYLMSVVNKISGYTCPAGKTCDVNGDGVVDILDLINEQQIAKQVTAFAPYAQYDYNNDMKLDSNDMGTMMFVANKLKTCPAGKNCDVNGDGTVNILDISKLQQLVNQSNALTLNQASVNLAVNKSSTITGTSPTYPSGATLTVGGNTNAAVVQTSNISPTKIGLTGLTVGTSAVNICVAGTSYCASVTVIVANPVSASPSSLSFSVAQNGTAPAFQTITVANAPAVQNLSATQSASPPWLNFGQITYSGSTATFNNITINAAGLALAPGTYNNTISIAGSFTGSPLSVPVTLTVTAPAQTNSTLNFTVDQTSPAASTVAPGTHDVTFAVWDVSATGGNGSLDYLSIGSDSINGQTNLSNIRIYSGSTLLGSVSGLSQTTSINGYAQAWNPVNFNPSIPMGGNSGGTNSAMIIKVVADVSPSASGSTRLGIVGFGGAFNSNLTPSYMAYGSSMTFAKPTLTVSLDSSSPAASTVAPGTSNVTLAVWDLGASVGNVSLNDLVVTSDNLNGQTNLSNIRLYSGNTLLGSLSSLNSWTTVFNDGSKGAAGDINFSSNLNIPNNSANIVRLVADVSASATGSTKLGITGFNGYGTSINSNLTSSYMAFGNPMTFSH